MSRDEWIEKAVEQYVLRGIAAEKSRLWAESILNNDHDAINRCPYIAADIDYRT